MHNSFIWRMCRREILPRVALSSSSTRMSVLPPPEVFDKAIEPNNLKAAVETLSKLPIPFRFKRSTVPTTFAVLVPFTRNSRGEPCMLLTHRSSRLRRDSNMISFPGGLQDESDGSDHVTTALRETHEEIGVDPSTITTYGVGPGLMTRNNMGLLFPVVGFMNLDFSKDESSLFHLNHDEVQGVHLIRLADLCNVNNWSYTRFKVSGVALPVYRDSLFDDRKVPRIWGLTAAIIHFSLMAVLPHEYKYSFDMLPPVRT